MNAFRKVMIAAVVCAAARAGTAAAVAPPETMLVWRAQLALYTCDATNADTDDRVRIRLNDNNVTYLDLPQIDDFEKGTYRVYELIPLKYTSTPMLLSDVTKLAISKVGNDGIKICSVDLRVNGRVIFQRIFSSPYLIDTGGVLTFSSSTLRGSAHWKAYGSPPSFPTTILASHTKSVIGALAVTHTIGYDLRWGSGVSLTKVSSRTLRVGVDMRKYVDVLIGSVPIDMSLGFNLTYACSGGRIQTTVSGISVHIEGSDFVSALTFGLVDLEAIVKNKLTPALSKLAVGFKAPTCPTITLGTSGNVYFSL